MRTKELVNGYERFPEQKVFRVGSDQYTNRTLKEIMKLVGINKQITFHCARHTFATIALELKIPIDIISKILGHRDLKTTQIYLRYFDEIKIQEMSKWNDL